MSEYYSERRERNEESKSWAENDREPWDSQEESDLVEYWDGHDEKLLIETAEVLGRTIEACRQRWYQIQHRGGAKRRRTSERTTEIDIPGGSMTIRNSVEINDYIGAFDEPEDVWWK